MDLNPNIKINTKYILDKNYSTHCIVTVIKTGKIFSTVKSEDGKKWDTMKNRLSEIENE